VSFIHRGGGAMSNTEKAKRGVCRDSIFKQALVAVYKLVDTVERLEDRLRELERRVDALTPEIHKEEKPIFYS
jgi:hypothetical protein